MAKKKAIKIPDELREVFTEIMRGLWELPELAMIYESELKAMYLAYKLGKGEYDDI